MVFGRGAEHEAITWNAPQWEGDGKMLEGGSHLRFLVWSKQLWLSRTSDAQFSVLRHSSFNPFRNSFGFLYGTPSPGDWQGWTERFQRSLLMSQHLQKLNIWLVFLPFSYCPHLIQMIEPCHWALLLVSSQVAGTINLKQFSWREWQQTYEPVTEFQNHLTFCLDSKFPMLFCISHHQLYQITFPI